MRRAMGSRRCGRLRAKRSITTSPPLTSTIGIRSRAPVVDGQRKLKEAARRELNALSREIAASRRQVKVIESQWGKPLRRLRRYEKEWLRLQGKDHLYRIDVELDQIMGFFRVALVNIASWFLSECFEKHPMSLARLLHAILMMPSEIRLP